MNEKFFAVVNKIINETEQIQDIVQAPHGDEYYFSFKGAVFSILKRADSNDWGRYSLYVYPKALSSAEIVEAYENGLDDEVQLVALHSNESSSLAGLLAQLFSAVRNADLGVDKLFDRLLS